MTVLGPNLSPEAQQPNELIYLAYVGAVHLAAEVLNRDVGLVRGGGKAA